MATQRDNDWVATHSAEEIDNAYNAGELDDLLNRPPTAVYGDGTKRGLTPIETATASEIIGGATSIGHGTSPASDRDQLFAWIDATYDDPAIRKILKDAATPAGNTGALGTPDVVTGPTWDAK